MKKTKKSLIIILIVAAILTFITFYARTRDNLRFKLSYEMANYTKFNNKYIKVNIPINNRIKYLKQDEILKFFKSGTGIVYFGYNTCPWCRNSVPVLIDAAIINNLDKIYYVDIHGINLKEIRKELYEILDPYLREREDGTKGLSVPDVYAVKKGKIKGHHIGTVESYQDPTKGMSKKQKKELKKIYTDLIKEVK